MACPYCNSDNFIPTKAVYNAEAYGSKTFTISCTHCNKKVDVTFRRQVVIVWIEKSTKKVDSWGG